MDDDWHWLRHHLLCARNYASRLAIAMGEVGEPHPRLMAKGAALEAIVDDLCPAEEDWGGANVLPFRPRVRA